MLGNGDHSLIKVEIVGPPGDRDSMEMVPDWTKANLEGIKQSFENVDWEAEFQGMSGSAAWDHLKEFIDKETERNVPKKMRRVGTRPLWMNTN